MEHAVGTVAAGLGYLVRVLVVLGSWIPATVGPALVLYGTYLISHAACYILAGLAVSLLTFARPNRRGARRR